MQYEYSNRSIPYVDEWSYNQDAATIEQLRQERQPQILILTVISPELHFDAEPYSCVEGSIREVSNERT